MSRKLLCVSTILAGVMGMPAVAAAQSAPAAPAVAAAQPSVALGALSDWTIGYYHHRSPDRVSEILAAIEPLTRDAGGAMFMVGFLSAVFEDHPDKLGPWLKDLGAMPEPQRKLVLQAVWFSGTPEAQEVLLGVGRDKLMEYFRFDLASRRAYPADDRLLRTPADLDFLWGRFFARGHDAPVRRIIAALPWQQNKPIATPATDEKKFVLLWAMGAAAQWGLTANARRHPRVLEICKAELAKATGPTREYLAKVVRTAAQNRTAGR
jgi:hypothetical protein